MLLGLKPRQCVCWLLSMGSCRPPLNELKVEGRLGVRWQGSGGWSLTTMNSCHQRTEGARAVGHAVARQRYWSLTTMTPVTNTLKVQGRWGVRWQRWLVRYIALYNVLGVVMHVNFLPWT
jgi:hypothetical protein